MAAPSGPNRSSPEPILSESMSWDDVYASGRELDLPWFSPTLDEEFDMALEHYSVRANAGPVLDLGTGPGTAAIEMAKRNYDVHALDISQHAVKMAKRRAGSAMAKQIKWHVTDLFHAHFESPLQMVYDRGVYHTLASGLRRVYPVRVGGWIKPRGLLFLKAFSTSEPGDYGPHRIPEEEIRTNFNGLFDVIKVEHTTYPGTLDHDPKANFYVLRRKAGERTIH